MNKLMNRGLLFLIMLLLSAKSVFAADLTLTKIGTFSTVGIDYDVVDYIGGVPMFEGTATPGAQVTVKIKTITGYTAAASPSGIWQYIPRSLDTGTNDVTITSGSKSLVFTLNFNVIKASPSATITPVLINNLPATGIWENVIWVIGVGIAIMYLGRRIKVKMNKWEGKG